MIEAYVPVPYDLDRPCGSLCPNQAAGLSPMITACPLVKMVNPVTGLSWWKVDCPEWQ